MIVETQLKNAYFVNWLAHFHNRTVPDEPVEFARSFVVKNEQGEKFAQYDEYNDALGHALLLEAQE